MAKWADNIGFAVSKEVEPGIWDSDITECFYFGDLISDRRMRQASGEVNDKINLTNVLSIVADQFAMENCSNMVYVNIMGTKWKITNVEVQYPRLTLTIGGKYNGKQA